MSSGETQMMWATAHSAPHTTPTQWHSINWAACRKVVASLQARIVKAQQASRPHKVKALQWLLTHSFAAKALAVRRVTENHGKHTPGIDGVTWKTPEAKWQAVHDLKRRGYRAKPLRRVMIPKAHGKQRPLGIPTMKDRTMQAVYLMALDPVAETTADRHSYGFRPHRSCADAITQCHVVLAGHDRAQWILEGDICGCFDHIRHDWLLTHIPLDANIVRTWLRAGVIEQQAWHATDVGTPQGGIISPVLANMTLDGLEGVLQTMGMKRNRDGKIVANPHKLNLVRYADDFIITGADRAVLEQQVLPRVEEFLAERGLTLSRDKTRITPIAQGVDFLGQPLRKYAGKMLITPAKHNTEAVLTKIRQVITTHAAASAAQVIQRLNPIIRGWANYHQHIAAKATFYRVDRAIQQALWRWARRRHRQKSATWIRRKYFPSSGRTYGGFRGMLNDTPIHLMRASEVTITRHPKGESQRNPYAPSDQAYFESRSKRQMTTRLSSCQRSVWKRQDGRCPMCGELFTAERDWHIHHQDGNHSNNSVSNLMMLHANCHRQVHHQ